MRTRRGFFAGLTACCLCGSAAASDNPFGTLNSREATPARKTSKPDNPPPLRTKSGIVACGVNQVTSGDVQQTIRHTSGNPAFDALMGTEINLLQQAYKVPASFAFMDDGDEPNAFAFRPGTLNSGSTVLMGLSLVQSAFQKYPQTWGAVVAGIMGHEWGHVFMYASGLQVPKYVMETHADFMAGWYMGCKSVYFRMPVALESLAQQMFQFGHDDGFFNPDAYGSPRQRAAAVALGFQHAHEAALYGANADPRYAFQYGLKAVEHLAPRE